VRRGTGIGERPASWKLDASGLLSAAAYVPSPNCDDRPQGADIELLVIHNISLPPGEFGGPGIVELFTNCLDPAAHPYYREIKGQKVSSHFLIRRDGELFQFVPCALRAWHAGQSEWRGRSRCNDFSVGVELEGTDDQPFADSQYSILAELTRALVRAYPIKDWVGHSDIATPPGRKTDPGQHFDWARFRAMLESGKQ
jgi:AmpD protein